MLETLLLANGMSLERDRSFFQSLERMAQEAKRERRAQEAEEKAVRLEGRVRALIQHEELSNTNANLVSELREKLKQAQQKFLSRYNAFHKLIGEQLKAKS